MTAPLSNTPHAASAVSEELATECWRLYEHVSGNPTTSMLVVLKYASPILTRAADERAERAEAASNGFMTAYQNLCEERDALQSRLSAIEAGMGRALALIASGRNLMEIAPTDCAHDEQKCFDWITEANALLSASAVPGGGATKAPAPAPAGSSGALHGHPPYFMPGCVTCQEENKRRQLGLQSDGDKVSPTPSSTSAEPVKEGAQFTPGQLRWLADQMEREFQDSGATGYEALRKIADRKAGG